MVFYGGSECYIVTMAHPSVFFTPLYFQNILGVSPILSAALLLPLVISQVLTTTISGFIVKYTNRTWASFFVGFVVWLAGQGAQLCFDQWTSRSVIIGVLLLQGLGIGATIQSSMSKQYRRES
jgi:hypothetical protein